MSYSAPGPRRSESISHVNSSKPVSGSAAESPEQVAKPAGESGRSRKAAAGKRQQGKKSGKDARRREARVRQARVVEARAVEARAVDAQAAERTRAEQVRAERKQAERGDEWVTMPPRQELVQLASAGPPALRRLLGDEQRRTDARNSGRTRTADVALRDVVADLHALLATARPTFAPSATGAPAAS